MALKKNIIANYASQLYAAGIGILILPLYIKYMGAEAYGLVGFFTMLQAWFALLDLGLTPTIARETARYHGGSMSALHYRQLFRALSTIFVGIAVIGGTALWLLAEPIAYKWLQVETLSMNAVVVAVQIMAVSVALRWLGGLYRGVITGSERLVWLSGFNAIIATLRFPAVFITMWQYGFTPTVFFWHQLAVAVVEVLGLYLMSNRLKPVITKSEIIGWSIQPVKPVLKFALTIAFTSSVWVLVTQTDKLILSGILPLEEYGYFTLAVMASGGIMLISVPLMSAIQPRLTRLYAEGKNAEFYALYENGVRVISIFPFFLSLLIAFYPYYFLMLWINDSVIASNTYEILRFYVLGSGFLSLAAFPSILQNAYGNLKYHFIGNLIMLFLLIPSSIFFSFQYGAIGASLVWLVVNFLYLVFWVSYSHHKLIPGKALGWMFDGIFKPVFTLLLCLAFSKILLHDLVVRTRLEFFIFLFCLSVFAYLIWYVFYGRRMIASFQSEVV